MSRPGTCSVGDFIIRRGRSWSDRDAAQRRYAMQDSGGLSYFTWDQNGMNLLSECTAAGALTADYAHGNTPVDGIGSMSGA